MTRHRFHEGRVAIAERLGLTDVATLDRRLLRWSGHAAATRGKAADVVAVDGSFGIIDPELGFDLHAGTLLAARARAVASGIATGQQVDDLASDLHAAKGGGYEWVSTPFFLDLTLRKPLAA